jgi:prepilin-type N-terminal cleavage/methylation domain-containing protein
MRARSSGSEDGYSLAEILVTIVIVGIAFSAVLGGLFTSIASSAYQRKQATADTLARDAAELVKNNAANPYVNCAGVSTYSMPSPPPGFQVFIRVSPPGVEYWKGSPIGSGPYAVDTDFQSSCPPDIGLQRITIQARSNDGQALETVQVLKRRVA